MNDKFSRELESTKSFQTEIQQIKKYENMRSRNNQYEDRISELEDGNTFKDQLLKDPLRARDY